jgi:hypothetical protein
MNTWTWALLGAVLGISLPWAVMRWRRPAEARPVPRSTPGAPARPAPGLRKAIARRFHGVSIRCPAEHCAAAAALTDRRFLPEEAPSLPLPGCTEARCQCAYAHHKDRRAEDDRRTGWGTFGGFAPSVPGGNRRKARPDRRRG